MPDFRDELSLLTFVLLNTAVFASAWFFASRRITLSRSQAMLDAALLGYAVQYASVGLPGVLHCLSLATMAATAVVFTLVFFVAGWKIQTPVLRYSQEPDSSVNPTRLFGIPQNRRSVRFFPAGMALFVITFTVMYARSQASLPVISNDALTYHFPAAVQWLQQHRISLFQTWFFNPANTYSPLAGSMFIVWMIAPFGSDVVARFVEVPALICVGIAIYRLCREMRVRVNVAALIAGAAMLARPLFLPCMMGKDDLFVAFFFIAALVALSRDRAGERWGAVRFGIALGLLVATKYTALLTVPILLLAIDGPRWRIRAWIDGLAIAVLFAGPWYLRNWVLTGNPIFPIGSLFTTAPSDAMGTWSGAMRAVLGGGYGLPCLLAVVLGIGWVLSVGRGWSHPIYRTCALGIVPGLLLFFFKSPFPEVRFVLPMFLLLFACSARGIERFCGDEKAAVAAGFLVFGAALLTVFSSSSLSVIAGFSAVGLLVVMFGWLALWWADAERLRWQAIVGTLLGIAFVYAYINWTAYCRNYRQTMFDIGTGYAREYPDSNQLWRFVNEKIPADATVAYTNIYFIYPLECVGLKRRLIYAPTRPGVKSIADLGWLGSNLSGEKLVPAAIRATVASPDQAVWLANLREAGAKYLIVGNGGVAGVPPEAAFASRDADQFSLIFEGAGGWIYQFNEGLGAHRTNSSSIVSTAQ